jgi:hypothetical protein
MKFSIIIGKGFDKHKISNLLILELNGLVINGDRPQLSWSDENGKTFLVFGTIFGTRRSDNSLSGLVDPMECRSLLESSQNVKKIEGRYVVVEVDSINNLVKVWSDQYGRAEVYYQKIDNALIISSGIDLLPIASSGGDPDNVGLAHSLTVFGCRPAKKHTLYKQVHRLGVGETLIVTDIKLQEYKIHEREDSLSSHPSVYKENDLNRYSEIFFEAIRARSSSHGNVVYLSSGWDSTAILAALVHLYGNAKVRCVIGRMRYSERSGVINQFEIDRAKAVADYFGVKLDIAEFDYRTDGPKYLEEIRPLFRSQQFSVFTGIGHNILAKKVKEISGGGVAVFAGEMSDGAHNLGYSQFTSIFHPDSFDFREYSDKMASYLFGPTFLGALIEGRHESDPVWQIFNAKYGDLKKDQLATGQSNILRQLLSSFFLRGFRFPMNSLGNSKLLTAGGAAVYSNESEEIYFKRIINEITKDNLYEAYLRLYSSFHWQSSTVSALEYTAKTYGLECALPFNDSALIDFLGSMPESWGRGLELKPTKYPLKWFLKNKVDYPWHLQVGPHSYTYDVDPKFSLLNEVFLHSSLSGEIKKTLKDGKFVDWLDSNTFDKDYINRIVKNFLGGDSLAAAEMNDLTLIGMHSTIGVY